MLSLTNEFEDERFGGAGTAVTGMVNMLDRCGVQQTVIVPRSEWDAPSWFSRGKGIKVLGLPRNSYYFGYLDMIKADIVCKEFPELCGYWDLIHIHAINFTSLAYTLAKEGVPILYSISSFLRKELGDPREFELQAQFKIQEELLMRCHRIHVISHSERDYLAGQFPQYLSKVEVLPLGISLPTERWQPRNQNGFLYVGRLLDYKGIEDLIKAMYLLSLQSKRQITLNIIGKGTDFYEGYLRQLVQSMKLGGSVHFHGWKPGSEVWQWMARSYALVIPSRREAFGMVALEGMAIGTPIIASNAGGLAEVLSNTCSLIFEAGNTKQLLKTLLTAINNPSLLRSLSEKGLNRVLQYEWDHLAPRYLTIINSMIHRDDHKL